MSPMSVKAEVDPNVSTTRWWVGTDGRWYPPYDGRSYGVPQWHAPTYRPPGLPVGKTRNPWKVVGLSLVTLGIYAIYWQYASFRDMRAFNSAGFGGGWGLFFALVFPVVNFFALPSEVGHVYTGDNKTEPVTWLTGFWYLIPIIGWAVWLFSVQKATNEVWATYSG